MMRIIKYVAVIIIGIIFLFVAMSDRKLTLGIVNSNAEIESVEVILDGELYKRLTLEESISPIEFVAARLNFGFHTIEVISKNCKNSSSFKFFNLIGYNINVEYQASEDNKCNVLIREAHFRLIYL